jgi:hypothetical protein
MNDLPGDLLTSSNLRHLRSLTLEEFSANWGSRWLALSPDFVAVFSALTSGLCATIC